MTNIENTIEKMFGMQLGSQTARDGYRTGLRNAVKLGKSAGRDPYHVILEMMEMEMEVALAMLAHADPSVQAGSLVNNANLGRLVHLESLRTIGAMYTELAKTPQHSTTVERSVDAVTRHVFGIAFAGSKAAGFNNLEALGRGSDPQDGATLASTAGKMIAHTATELRRVSGQSFEVEELEAGQLLITPRYDVYKTPGGDVCPATGARIELDNSTRSALFVSMQIPAEVVITDVYPSEFPIVSGS